MTIEFDRVAFKAWLERMKPEAVAGECLDECGCPIARFLASLGHDCVVGGETITSITTSEMIDTPKWASEMLLGIDTDGSCLRDGPITARECLEILEGIEE